MVRYAASGEYQESGMIPGLFPDPWIISASWPGLSP